MVLVDEIYCYVSGRLLSVRNFKVWILLCFWTFVGFISHHFKFHIHKWHLQIGTHRTLIKKKADNYRKKIAFFSKESPTFQGLNHGEIFRRDPHFGTSSLARHWVDWKKHPGIEKWDMEQIGESFTIFHHFLLHHFHLLFHHGPLISPFFVTS